MYLENTIYYDIFDNENSSRNRSNDIYYNRMKEVSNKLERMDEGLYYDVAYKEERSYNTKNILKNNYTRNNYTRYDELIMDHNTMYNMKNSNSESNNSNRIMKSVIGRIKELMCCL